MGNAKLDQNQFPPMGIVVQILKVVLGINSIRFIATKIETSLFFGIHHENSNKVLAAISLVP